MAGFLPHGRLSRPESPPESPRIARMADVPPPTDRPATAHPPAGGAEAAPEDKEATDRAAEDTAKTRDSRVFRVVVDETAGMRVAMRFGGLRGRPTGGTAAMARGRARITTRVGQ